MSLADFQGTRLAPPTTNCFSIALASNSPWAMPALVVFKTIVPDQTHQRKWPRYRSLHTRTPFGFVALLSRLFRCGGKRTPSAVALPKGNNARWLLNPLRSGFNALY